MAMVSLENQKFLGRQLNNLRKNVPEISGTGEKTGQSARLPALGFAGFILLGGFALLKDIFDFVFVAQLFFKSKWTTASETASVASDIGSLLAVVPLPHAQAISKIAAALGWASVPLSWIGSFMEAKTQAEGVILPFAFTNMFMITVVAVLLLSGLGLKSYEIFLSSRSIILSFIAVIVEIIPVLNILPWMTIYVILLFIHVKSLLKKQQEKEQPA
jgi:hypothetical protein